MSNPNRQLRVFLCHASQDKPDVRELYSRLKQEDWIAPWLDEEKLSLGQLWTIAIEDAIEDADVIIIFLSSNSVRKEGFVQRELNYAWELSLEKPHGTIFLIPFRLDNCEIPRHLKSRQWGDYFGEKKENTYQALLHSLKQRHSQKMQLEAIETAEHEKAEREAKAKLLAEEKAKQEKEAQEHAKKLAREKLEREKNERRIQRELKEVSKQTRLQAIEEDILKKPKKESQIEPTNNYFDSDLLPDKPRKNNQTLIVAVVIIIIFLCCSFILGFWIYGDTIIQSLSV